MEKLDKKTAEIVNNEFIAVIKVVILGFIAFDFFSPLTFKYIAGIFTTAEERTDAFIWFKVFYLLAPLAAYISYQWLTGGYKELKGYVTPGLKEARWVYSAILFLFSVIIAMSVMASKPSWHDMLKVGDNRALLSIWVILVLACAGLFGGYLIFDRIRSRKDMRLSWTLRKKAFQSISVSFTATFAGLVILYIITNPRKQADDKTDKQEKDMTAIYTAPFRFQHLLQTKEKQYESVQEIDQEINKTILVTEYRLLRFGQRLAVNANAKKRESVADPLPAAATDPGRKNVGDLFEDPERHPKIVLDIVDAIHLNLKDSDPPSKIELANTHLEMAKSFMTYYKYTFEDELNNLQRKAKGDAEILLKHVQLTDLMILLALIFVLFFFYKMRLILVNKEERTLHLKSVIVIYILMFLQMLKPVDPNHINLKDPAWPFTYSNWYLPGFMQSIGTINTTTNTTEGDRTVYGGAADLGEMELQIAQLRYNTYLLSQIVYQIKLENESKKQDETTRFKTMVDKVDSIKSFAVDINLNTRKPSKR